MRLIILLLVSFFSINACEDTDSSMCSEEEASVLVNKFTRTHFKVRFEDIRVCYQPEFRKAADGFYLYLRETDCTGRSRVDRDPDGRPIVFFPLDEEDAMIRLHDSFVWRYFEEDLFRYITAPGFHSFPGLSFVLDLARKKVDDAISSLNDSCGLLPPPYNEKLNLDSNMGSYCFSGLFKLYLEISSYNGSKISSIAKVIKGLHDFCTAKDEVDVKIKHKKFVILLEENFVVLQERHYSIYLRQIIGLYKSAAANLGDLGIEFRKELQSSPMASHVNLCRKIGKGGMDTLLKRFRKLLLNPYSTNLSGNFPVSIAVSSGTTFEDISGVYEVMETVASFCSLEDIGRLLFTCKDMKIFADSFFDDGRRAYELLADSGVSYPHLQRVFTLGDDRYLHGKLSSVSLWLYFYKEYLQLVRINPLVVADDKIMLPNQAGISFVRGLAIAMKKLQEAGSDEAAKILPVFRAALLG